MKYFKFLLINVIAFFLLFFLFSLLFPGQVVTSKTVDVIASKEIVLQKINNTADWKNWNAFADGDIIKTNSGRNGDSLVFTFKNYNRSLLHTQFSIYQQQANSVLVSWAVIEKLPWYKPWKKFSAMIVNKEMAAVMDTALSKFKIQAEAIK
jgi:hypothetical protein